jgi:hypothetical protein
VGDVDLLAFGCTVTFIALGGAYVILRERFGARAAARREPVSVVVREPAPQHASR